MTRRYERVVAGEGKIPDLVLIDGGQGQLSAAAETDADRKLIAESRDRFDRLVGLFEQQMLPVLAEKR